MLNKKLVVLPLALALFLVLAPAPSQAAPWGWSAAATPSAAGFLLKVGSWWHRLLDGADRPAPRQPSAQQKNGCGIDPNGEPHCGG